MEHGATTSLHHHNEMRALVLATRNAHKVQEIQAILGRRWNYFSLPDFPSAPAVKEDAHTFAGNAIKKAVELARWLGSLQHSPKIRISDGTDLSVLADDSGLEVDALNGAPGVYSARFAALDPDEGVSGAKDSGNSSDAANNAKLLRLLEDVPDEKRTARFVCVLALVPVLGPADSGASPVCSADELELQTEIFEGRCKGRIAHHPSGSGGFGYDPLFLPTGCDVSFAELGEEIKNKISHRANALEKLRRRFGI